MLHHLCGLGSDGASVMLGSRGGVSKLLRDKIPFIVSNHCIAHHLGLACGQAANQIPYLKLFLINFIVFTSFLLYVQLDLRIYRMC